MKKNFSSKKSAFSLIELSIVLIIIGLLIAGITGGASLIKSSELRSIMGEARGYAVSVNSFFTQYDQYPGDANVNVGNNSGVIAQAVGDRDNKIEFVNDATSPVAEGIDAWFDLKDIGAIDMALTALTHTSATAGTLHVPVALTMGAGAPGSKIKGAGWVFDYNQSALQNVVVLTGNTAGYVSTTFQSLVNPTSSTGTTGAATVNTDGANIASTEIITAGDALAIDSKIDDGKANTGNVLAVNQISATKCSLADAYVVTAGSLKVCALSFRVDVSS